MTTEQKSEQKVSAQKAELVTLLKVTVELEVLLHNRGA